MSVDFSQFHKLNVTDTCAVWHVLSSRLLYSRALEAGVQFCCTKFVDYECLLKPRKKAKDTDATLQDRLKHAQSTGAFKAYSLSIEDLQEIEVLQNRKRLGKGELSSMAFAKKTSQAFMTDDQGARKLAAKVMTNPGPQTTPHLFGWLLFQMLLTDADKQKVIDEHTAMECCLKPHFEEAYNMAIQHRLMAYQGSASMHGDS